MGSSSVIVAVRRHVCLWLLILLLDQGRASSSDMMTVVFPPLTVIQVKSLMVFSSDLNSTHTVTVIDNKSSINFQFTLSAYGTFRRLMSSSYREMSFSVSPVPRGLHVYGKWGIAVSNTDAFSVFTDDMLGTSYIISTWTACCNATAFILISAMDTSSTTVNVTLPASSSLTLTADNQNYTTDFTLQLGLRDVVTITSTSDLSGTMVTGNDTILVQSGANKAAVQGATKGQLIETLPPLTNMGTVHLGVPTTGRSSDVYRLVSSSASNTVTIQEDGVSSVTVTLTTSSPVYDHIATQPVIITSSEVLLVTQYSASDDASVIPPSMTFIPSTSHWASYYIITEADSSLTRPEYVTLVTMTSYTSGIRLTYSNQTQIYVTGWSTYLSDATYSYVTLPITESFVLDHQTGQAFMVIQYGVRSSWAYSFVPVFTQTNFSVTTTSATTAATTSAANTTASNSSVTSSSNVTNSASSSNNITDSGTWLDDSASQAILGVAVSVTAVAVASFVAWRVVVTHSTKAVTSLSTTVVSSSPTPPFSTELTDAGTTELTRVDT